MDLTLEITDDYSVRNEIVSQLHGAAIQWLTLAISRAPIEVQSILQVCPLIGLSAYSQRYLVESRDVLIVDSVEMGAGLAMQFAKSISKVDRQECE
jgi:phosphatidylinositol 4-kinase